MIHKSERWNGTSVPYDAPIRDLEEALTESGGKAATAFQALAFHHDPQALEVLKKQTLSTDWRYRRLAIEAISIHPHGQTCGDILVQALSDPSQYVVRTTCEHEFFSSKASPESVMNCQTLALTVNRELV